MRFRILIIGLTAILLTGVGAVFGLHHGESPDPGSAQASSSLPAGQAPADQLAAKHSPCAEAPQRGPRGLPRLGCARLRIYRACSRYRRSRVLPEGRRGAATLTQAAANGKSGPPWSGSGRSPTPATGFATARDLAARALRMDPYSADAYGVLADAQTQLGHPAAATEAIQHMLDLRPGLAAYARASYDLEQQGRLGDAVALMRRALGDAVDPADIAFCRYQLGELAWRAGRLDDAETE